MKMSLLIQLVLFVGFISLLVCCGKSPYAGQTAATAATFSAIQANILIPNCADCHSTQRAQGGFSVSSYQEVMSSPGAISPFQPSASELYKQTVNGNMPKRMPPLSPSQLQSIYNWLSYGAPNN